MRTAAPSFIMTLAITLIAASNANAEIAWQQDLRAAHAQAQREGKLLLLHFYTDNCSWCDKLEQGAFKSEHVGETIGQNFVPVKIHANSSPKLAEMFKVSKFPTDVIVTTDGKTLSHAVSPQSSDRYVAMLTSTYPALLEAKSLLASKASETPAAATSPTPAPTTAPATSPVASPSPTMSIAANNAPASKPTVESNPTSATPPMPGYAAAPSPTPELQVTPPVSSDSTAPFTLPGKGLSGGAKGQLAGARSEGLTLEMPEQLTPNTAASVATTVTDASSVTDMSSVADASATPVNPQPPAEQPELAMQGFCPVTVINEDKWVEGKPEFGVIHLGKLYLFTTAENMNHFLADPVPYTPVLNEIDVVRFFEERKIVPGKREWGLKDPVYNRMFFFADEAAMNHFYNEYERYTDAAIEVMGKAVKDANPGI